MALSTGGGELRITYSCDVCHRAKCQHFKACPSCAGLLFQYTPPVRGYATSNGAWLCLWCSAIVCVWCYHAHSKKHPPTFEETS